MTQAERNQIFARIGQIKGQIAKNKDRINENYDERRSLQEAIRFHERESRKRCNRDVGYQGGDCDRRLTIVMREISELRDENNRLYEEKNGLYERLKNGS